MNRIFIKYIVLLIFLFGSNNVKSQPIPPLGKVWLPVSELTDEFNDTSLDRSKWLNHHPYWLGRQPSQFDTNNVSIHNGYLILKSTVSNYDSIGFWIASSCVTSNTKAMQPGYYSESRIKCPALSMTGSFWFQGSYSEIDVAENFGAPTSILYEGYETHMNSTLHYFVGGFANDIYTQWSASILQPSCADTFFTYGVWWEDSITIILYLNGQQVHTSTPAGSFNENMYMFFDMEAYNWGIGLPTITSLDDSTRNTQYVDWVHTYKLGPETNSSLTPNTVEIDKSIYLYPNPTSGSFYINQDENITVEIYTMTGILICIKQINGRKLIQTDNLSTGVYIVRIRNKNSTITQRLIINKK
jgi:hypothetical protein